MSRNWEKEKGRSGQVVAGALKSFFNLGMFLLNYF
jgi:hypothetical protein